MGITRTYRGVCCVVAIRRKADLEQGALFGIFGTAGVGCVCLSEHDSVLVLFDLLD